MEDLTTYDFVLELKLEAYRLLSSSAGARRDFKFSRQLRDALSDVEADVAEGFARKNPGDFANFLRFGLASLAEATTRLRDGVAREHFTAKDVSASLVWAERARSAMESLRESQLKEAERRKKNRKRKRS